MYGVPMGNSTSGASPGETLLGVGSYHASGSRTNNPVVGGVYTSTTKFTDGSAGDTTTGETSSGTIQTEVRVLAAAISIATWAQTKNYDDTLSQTFQYWNGAAWVAMSDTNGVAWPTFLGATSASRTATFSGVPSASIFKCISTTTGATNLTTSDSRPA